MVDESKHEELVRVRREKLDSWRESGGAFPNDFRPDALAAAPFGRNLRNTAFLCIANVLAAIFSSAVVAYGFARLRFRGKRALFIIMISTMALPGQVTMIPIFAMFSALGWYGTFLPLIVPAFFGAPFYIFLLAQFFRTLPEDIAEAARIDGASEWRIFTRIFLP